MAGPASDTVVGIDVGGPRKGFHAVALGVGGELSKYASRDAMAVAAWCRAMGARVVAIDAPCRWSLTGRARPAERALAAAGMHAFATPSRAAAQGRPFYLWMLNGAVLYEAIERDYRLFDGDPDTARPLCCETFPQAVACALAGRVVSARHKGLVRRRLLRAAGMDIGLLTNIDLVDAALCALAARALLTGRFRSYGEAAEGFVVVPEPLGLPGGTDGS